MTLPRIQSDLEAVISCNSLDLIKGDLIAGAVVELGDARAFVRRHELGVFEGTAGFEVDSDAGSPKVWQPILTARPSSSARRRLEVIGLGRAVPIFITACCSQDVMRSARRDPARAIASCGWRDACPGR